MSYNDHMEIMGYTIMSYGDDARENIDGGPRRVVPAHLREPARLDAGEARAVAGLRRAQVPVQRFGPLSPGPCATRSLHTHMLGERVLS
jgi:hypothetical protein